MKSRYDTLKQDVYQCNMDLPRHGLVKSTFGNVSAIDRTEGVVAIKPSGVEYDALQEDDIVILDVQGNVVDGTLNPSSDTKTHLRLYHNFPKIGGIAHTHATYSVAWAQAGRAIPILGTTHADYLPINVPCTEFMSDEMVQGDYEIETGNQIIKAFETLSYEQIEMILVAGHGPFTWGSTPREAVHNSIILEELAKMAFLTMQINPDAKQLDDSLIKKHFERKHGPNAYYGQG